MSYLPFFIKNPLLSEQVEMKVIEISSIPAGGNPFHYDQTSCGSEIRHGIYEMSRTNGADYLYFRLDNIHSGQRFEFVPIPVVPKYVFSFAFFDVPSEDDLVTGFVCFKNIKYKARPDLEYIDAKQKDVQVKVNTFVGTFTSPIYVAYKGWFVNYEDAKNLTKSELHQFIASNEFCHTSDIPTEIIQGIYEMIKGPQ